MLDHLNGCVGEREHPRGRRGEVAVWLPCLGPLPSAPRSRGKSRRPGGPAKRRSSGRPVRDIAERAELSPAAIYYHFTSKQDVLATIMERGIERLLMRTRTALAEAG